MNSKIRIKKEEVLSHNWYLLKKTTFDYLRKDGSWQTQSRETYDRGNGATILLFNKETKKIILTRQFRFPTYVNGNEDGMLIEACAGLLDKDNAEECIRKETEQETGYKVKEVKKIFEVYMSPGSVTEILHFFIGEYSKESKITDGGGMEEEGEDIEVLEIDIDEALSMIDTGKIRDAKTIMLVQYVRLKGVI